jgi:chromosome partitioning protein
MRVITVANRKGGSAKTTTVVNLAYGLATRGQRVLVLDLDNQGHVLHGFSQGEQSPISPAFPITHFYKQLVAVHPNIDITEVNNTSSDIGSQIHLQAVREWCDDSRLCARYDVILIDTPPTLNAQLMAALAAATEIVIPAAPLPLSSDGVDKLLFACLKAVSERKFRAKSIKLLPVMVEKNVRLHRLTLNQWRERFGNAKVFSPIYKCIKLAEAFSTNKPISEFAPKCRGAKDYDALCNAMISE